MQGMAIGWAGLLARHGQIPCNLASNALGPVQMRSSIDLEKMAVGMDGWMDGWMNREGKQLELGPGNTNLNQQPHQRRSDPSPQDPRVDLTLPEWTEPTNGQNPLGRLLLAAPGADRPPTSHPSGLFWLFVGR